MISEIQPFRQISCADSLDMQAFDTQSQKRRLQRTLCRRIEMDFGAPNRGSDASRVKSVLSRSSSWFCVAVKMSAASESASDVRSHSVFEELVNVL